MPAQLPMSLDVGGMVKKAGMEDVERILFGSCVDGCPKKTIRLEFSRGK